jgi:hypothetical protein
MSSELPESSEYYLTYFRSHLAYKWLLNIGMKLIPIYVFSITTLVIPLNKGVLKGEFGNLMKVILNFFMLWN